MSGRMVSAFDLQLFKRVAALDVDDDPGDDFFRMRV